MWAAVAPQPESPLLCTGGSWEEGAVVFRGSLEAARGTKEQPLYLLYVNGTDVNQTDDVRIDLILGYE